MLTPELAMGCVAALCLQDAGCNCTLTATHAQHEGPPEGLRHTQRKHSAFTLMPSLRLAIYPTWLVLFFVLQSGSIDRPIFRQPHSDCAINVSVSVVTVFVADSSAICLFRSAHTGDWSSASKHHKCDTSLSKVTNITDAIPLCSLCVIPPCPK